MSRTHHTPDRTHPGAENPAPAQTQPQAHPGEPLRDQVFVAFGYGTCATAVLIGILGPHNDDLRLVQLVLIFALLSLASLLAIRWRARTRRPARTRTPTR